METNICAQFEYADGGVHQEQLSFSETVKHGQNDDRFRTRVRRPRTLARDNDCRRCYNRVETPGQTTNHGPSDGVQGEGRRPTYFKKR